MVRSPSMADCMTSGCARRGAASVQTSHYRPGLQQTLEIFLAVILELDLPALATRLDRDVGSEPLLQFDLPLLKPREARRHGTGMSLPELASDVGFGAADREPLGGHVTGRGQLISRIFKGENGSRVPSR